MRRKTRKLQKGGYGIQDFYDAIESENYDKVKEILAQNPKFIIQRSAVGNTPLTFAVMTMTPNGRGEEIVKFLINKGASVKAVNNDEMTPLHIASIRGKSSLAKLLIDKGADVDAKDKHWNTPLIYAVNKNGYDVAKVLIDNEAGIDFRGTGGNTPLHIASSKNFLDIAELLIENYANIDATNGRGDTPLDLAAHTNSIDVLNLLVSNYAYISDEMRLKVMNNEYSPEVNLILMNVIQEESESDEESEEESESEEEEESALLSSNTIPANAPLKCFDPLMASNTIIEEGSAVFYIQNDQGKTIAAGCLDEDTLDNYKSNNDWLFYRCKETTPVSALYIVRGEHAYSTKYRLLNFAMRIYVKDSEAQSLVAGKKYVLKPIEPLGRIVSENFFESGNAVSAVHCGPADGSMLYKIYEVRSEGGRRRTRKRSHKKRS
jgi:ankyrin repeat protein